jgi:surface protein
LDVSNWNVSAVTTLDYAFRACTSLVTLDVSNWDVSAVTNLSYFLTSSSGLTTIVYDATLINWDALTVTASLTPDFGPSNYTGGGAAEAARANLISSDGWTITDGGVAP